LRVGLAFWDTIKAPVIVFTAFHFLHNLPMGPNKLDCFISVSCKYWPGTNLPAYWAYAQVTSVLT